MNIRDFYKNKKVFITGHTGFKGTWMCKVLEIFGAEVLGYSLEPPTKPNLFEMLNFGQSIKTIVGDVRDLEKLSKCMNEFKPEIVIHMAAQPIVRESYSNPVYTYETNVMGTVNILEAVRLCNSVKSVVNVTTDKVYENNEWVWGYRENDRLNGYDPYSNSKSCSELVTNSYKNSFFKNCDIGISTARAGNVIGGGDFAKDRIIPDCVRAVESNTDILIRNPNSIRPYQHVLEPVIAYLKLAMMQYYDYKVYSGNYNIGPDECDCVTTGELATLFCEQWGQINWKNISDANSPHEASFLKLDCSKIKNVLNWQPIWHINEAVSRVVEWSKVYLQKENVARIMEKQIEDYLL